MERRIQSSRPQSAINIIHLPDVSDSNPEPLSDADKTFGEFISPQRLREVSGIENLTEIEELKIKVDSAETSIGNIGLMAPNLKCLNLSNSFIASVRDLGTSLNFLNTLWLSRCCLKELDGISCLASVKELYLAYNEIFDISPLGMLEQLQVLDLEGNNVNDVTQVEFLALCSNLSMLTLRGNPVELSPSPTTNKKDLKFYNYRDAMLTCLPQLNVLDDKPFVTKEKIDGEKVKEDVIDEDTSGNSIFAEDMKVIQESLKILEGDLGKDEALEEENEFTRPATARKREGSSKRSSASSTRDLTSPSSIANSVSPDIPEEDEYTSSSLTLGRVMCGNPVAALRSRSRVKNIKSHETQVKIKSRLEQPYQISSISESNTTNYPEESHTTDVLEELKKWREMHSDLFEDLPRESTTETVNNNRPLHYTPTPPSTSRPRNSLLRRSAPHGLKSLSNSLDANRPHTSGEIRHRRFDFPNPYKVLPKHDSGISSQCSVSSQDDDDSSCENTSSGHHYRPFTARTPVKLSPIVRNEDNFRTKMDGS